MAESGSGDMKEGDTHVAYSSAGWSDFYLKTDLQKAIDDNGFEHPSPVQHKAIPLILAGKNVIVQGKSGMGKTAVFVISILQMMDPASDDVQAIVLSPTRELAEQTCKEFQRFSKRMSGVRVYSVYGGRGAATADVQKEFIRANKPQIISATPGRLLDLIQKGSFSTKSLRFFVVDECDKMFSADERAGGMFRTFHDIFMKTPSKKQTMFFSATIPEDVLKLSKSYMRDPEICAIDKDDKLMLEGLTQRYIKVEETRKSRVLSQLLDNISFNQCIIFVNDVQRAEALCRVLNSCNFPATFSHARLPTSERIARYNQFKNNDVKILVATGLWDRSLDIVHVNLVISYDLPPYDDKDEYLHRIGRAGRFGTKGLAIAFVANEKDTQYIEDVQKRFNKEITELKEDEEIDASTYSSA